MDRHLTYRLTTLSGSNIAVVIEFPPWTTVASAADVETDIDETGVTVHWPHSDEGARLKTVQDASSTRPLIGASIKLPSWLQVDVENACAKFSRKAQNLTIKWPSPDNALIQRVDAEGPIEGRFMVTSRDKRETAGT
eukprot:CAMPEP_0118950890 /NCGR_PEP_ID=MMETSP1169-20130426/52180_1 /TAXON_ID=36882 /ORGANISM="Pyramimonas obovata, Strain CCMP722" /LENGTH=136 /DNA_ID=CAMNT_0006897825 /DNA_START=47 /DNA_END=454 /DNA_ORIENTATION=-